MSALKCWRSGWSRLLSGWARDVEEKRRTESSKEPWSNSAPNYFLGWPTVLYAVVSQADFPANFMQPQSRGSSSEA